MAQCPHTVQESCHCFWPQQPGDGDVHGKLRVSLKRLGSYGDITESRLEVVESGGRVSAPHRLVTLLQLSSWPPLGLPHPTAILSLVDLLSKAQRSSPGKHIIVMCRYVQCMCVQPAAYIKSLKSLKYLEKFNFFNPAVTEWVALGRSSACIPSWSG